MYIYCKLFYSFLISYGSLEVDNAHPHFSEMYRVEQLEISSLALVVFFCSLPAQSPLLIYYLSI